MLYFTANKLTIKPCLKHLANELHLFGCYLQSRQKFRYKLNFNELNLTGVNLTKINFSFSSLTSK